MIKLLSVIIPAYNEEKTIGQIIPKVFSASLPQGVRLEVIVVDDGSTDGTGAVLEQLSKRFPLQVYHKPNGGKASALKLGFSKAHGDALLVQDADLEYDPIEYSALLNPIQSGEARVVYGSRFLGQIRQMKPINRLANRISNWTMKFLWKSDITDINTCYKVFEKSALEGITIESAHFAFETEMTIKLIKKGIRIKEVPINYKARTVHEGKKIKWATALQMYWPILRERFRG